MSAIAPARIRRWIYPCAGVLVILIVTTGLVLGKITLTLAASILALALPPLGLATANVTNDDDA